MLWDFIGLGNWKVSRTTAAGMLSNENSVVFSGTGQPVGKLVYLRRDGKSDVTGRLVGKVEDRG